MVSLKRHNPNLKILLGIGGWDVKSYGFNSVTNPNNTNVSQLAAILYLLKNILLTSASLLVLLFFLGY